MAISKENVLEFVHDTFRPLVSVLCSEQVERHCQKNNLSFVKLIQPFCSIKAEAIIKDVNSCQHSVKNFKIVCHDLNEPSLSRLTVKKKLGDIVSNSFSLDSQNKNNQQFVNSYLGIPLDHGSISQQSTQLPSNRKLDPNLKTPWYQSYRKYFLESLPYSDHEFLRHYVSCIVAVSTSEPDPLDKMNRMIQSLQQPHHPSLVSLSSSSNSSPPTLLQDAKWFVPNFLRFHVLVHDVSEQNDRKAEAVYQAVKDKFGNHCCHLLHINSRQVAKTSDIRQEDCGKSNDNDTKSGNDDGSENDNPWIKYLISQNIEVPRTIHKQVVFPQEAATCPETSSNLDHPLALDPLSSTHHDDDDNTMYLSCISSLPSTRGRDLVGDYLTLSDIDRLKICLNEFILNALVPWAEKTLKILNEQASNRKGIKGSLFNASKWFGRTRPVSQNVNSSSVVYSSDSPEMQLRRLADLSFLFQLYELSYQTYHTIKKDFNNDGAWMHFAGALEMACLSVFLQGFSSTRQYPFHYMETAIKTYYSTSRSINFAARATMLSTEILKSKNLFAEAATQFMTVTSEDSDLLSALFLEQTAHCFLNMRNQLIRKYAFHMVLAGHRFNKAGQKKHVLRCYTQALEIFRGKEWSLAEDHMYLTIGSQAYNIRELSLATAAFLRLLTPHSKQSPNQQAAFFTQYFNIYKQQMSMMTEDAAKKLQLEMLPLPIVDKKSIKVLCHHRPDESLLLEEGKVAASGVSLNDNDERDSSFVQLERKIVSVVHPNSSILSFKPTIFCHNQQTTNLSNVLAVVGEPILIEMRLDNPLKIPLLLMDVQLLWRFYPSSSVVGSSVDGCSFISNEPMFLDEINLDQLQHVESELLSTFHLEELETKELRISLTCKKPGKVEISGLAFQLTSQFRSSTANGSSIGGGAVDGSSTTGMSLGGTVSSSASLLSIASSTSINIPTDHHDTTSAVLPNGLPPQNQPTGSTAPSVSPTITTAYSFPGMVELVVRGNRLNATKEDRMNVKYSKDERLHIDALPVGIKLEMYLHNFPTSLLCGEVVQCQLEFVNSGQQTVASLLLTSNHLEMFSFCDDSLVNHHKQKGVVQITLPINGLAPGQKVMLTLRVQCPEKAGIHNIDILVYYAGNSDDADDERRRLCLRMKYRLIKHSTCIKSESSLVGSCQTFPSFLLFPDPGDDVGGQDIKDATGSSKDEEEDDDDDDAIYQDAVENSFLRSSINMSLQIDNINMGYDFTIIKLICISKEWILQPQKISNIENMRDLSIKPGEYHSITLQACKGDIPEFQKNTVSSVSFSDNKINLEVFNPNEIWPHILQTPDSDNKKRNNTEEALNKTVETKLKLVVIWKATYISNPSKDTRFGQHVLSLEKLDETVECVPVAKSPLSVPQVKFTSTPVKNNRSDDQPPIKEILTKLIKTSLNFPTQFLHDFSSSRPCLLTVEGILFNCSGIDLQVSVEVGSPAVGQHTDEQHPTNHILVSPPLFQPFLWFGRTRVSLLLRSNQSATVQLKARVLRPGVYDLSCIKTYASSCKSRSRTTTDNAQKALDSIPPGGDVLMVPPHLLSELNLVPQKSLNPLLISVGDARQIG